VARPPPTDCNQCSDDGVGMGSLNLAS
jgi:hypothetical protein